MKKFNLVIWIAALAFNPSLSFAAATANNSDNNTMATQAPAVQAQVPQAQAPTQLPPQAPPPAVPVCNGNQNNIYDSRVPPAGVYTTREADGSSNTTYTTGEKKPYYVDNNCNNAPTPPIQPIIQPNVNLPTPK